jgi:hypothetical protein
MVRMCDLVRFGFEYYWGRVVLALVVRIAQIVRCSLRKSLDWIVLRVLSEVLPLDTCMRTGLACPGCSSERFFFLPAISVSSDLREDPYRLPLRI